MVPAAVKIAICQKRWLCNMLRPHYSNSEIRCPLTRKILESRSSNPVFR